MMMVLILPPIFIVGIIILVLGIRGYRVGDHPVCRACAFDLFGLPPTQALCPECGGSLSAGVLIGHKHRRKWLIVFGIILLLLPLTFAGILAANIDYEHYKPLWWLKREATSMTLRKAAVDEVTLRLKNLELTKAQIDEFADFALAQQADMKTTWLPEFGDFIQTARSLDKLDDERWKRYAIQAAQPPDLVIRQKVRRGDPLIVGERETPARVGTSMPSQLVCERQLQSMACDIIQPQENTGGGGSSLSIYGGGMSWRSIPMDSAKLKTASNGKHHVHAVIDQRIQRDWNSKDAIAIKRCELDADFELVPADAPVIKEIRDPSLQGKMNKSFVAENFEWNWGDYYMLQIKAVTPPVATAWEVIVKSGDREWQFSKICFLANSSPNSSSSYGTGGNMKDFTADKVDVILRSNLDACINSMDQYEYWVGEVIIKDVPVKRPPKKTTTAK